MNYSSGIYDVNSYNLTTNNATVLSTLNIEKITCECDCIIVRGYITKHMKTPKHKDMLEDKKLSNKDQLEKLNEILEAQKRQRKKEGSLT